MLSIVIPTYNAEETLTRTLSALVPAVTTGVVREVVIADGGSTDGTAEISEAAGCVWVSCEGGRGAQLAAGAEKSHRGDWLLFLNQDTVLDPGWSEELVHLIDRLERSGREHDFAATYRLVFADVGWKPRLLEKLAAARCILLARPTGAQGLLISRRLYARIGGHRPSARREDVDIMRRIGRGRLCRLKTAATMRAPERRRSSGLLRSLGRSVGLFAF